MWTDCPVGDIQIYPRSVSGGAKTPADVILANEDPSLRCHVVTETNGVASSSCDVFFVHADAVT